MASYVITGTNRGLGLELVRQLAAEPANVVSYIFATSRTPSPKLEELNKTSKGRVVNIIIEDLTSDDVVGKAAAKVKEHLGGKGLDVLVNMAGVLTLSPGGKIENLPASTILSEMNTNLISAHTMTQQFLPLLRQGKQKKVINVSSTMGSIAKAEDFHRNPSHSYKITKSALNSMTKQYALDLADEGFAFVAISPGWVKTDLGGQGADLELSEAGPAVRDLVMQSDKSRNGKFFNIYSDVKPWYKGDEQPW